MVIVIIYLEEMYIKIKYSVFFLSVWYSQAYSMVNVFGDSIGEVGGLGNLQVVRKVITISGKYVDYTNGIHASHKLGFPAYQIASEGSPTLVFTYEKKVFCLGAHHQHLDELTSIDVTKTHYLAYWKEDSSSGGSSGGNATSIKGGRGIQGKHGATGEAGPIGPHGPKGVIGDIGPPGGAGVKGDEVGPKGEQGVRGLVGEIGPRGDKGKRGYAGEIGHKGGNGDPDSE